MRTKKKNGSLTYAYRKRGSYSPDNLPKSRDIFKIGLHQHINTLISTHQHITCTHQRINALTHQHINTLTNQHINTSTQQHINTSTHQHINISCFAHTYCGWYEAFGPYTLLYLCCFRDITREQQKLMERFREMDQSDSVDDTKSSSSTSENPSENASSRRRKRRKSGDRDKLDKESESETKDHKKKGFFKKLFGSECGDDTKK